MLIKLLWIKKGYVPHQKNHLFPLIENGLIWQNESYRTDWIISTIAKPETVLARVCFNSEDAKRVDIFIGFPVQ